MRNERHFEALIPGALRSVPYILQSHVFKAYCALESLRAHRPQLPSEVWQYCCEIIEGDEPKVGGLIAPALQELDEIVDSTSGRDFGPDWILSRGLIPLSYWAMGKKHEELGFEGLFRSYIDKALDHPKYLGHELSVFAGHWYFFQAVLAEEESSERMGLFIQRFTEFAVATFHSGNDTTFEHPPIDIVPSETEILTEALTNPGFFGHNVLAFVWAKRLKPLMTDEQYNTAMRSLTVMNRWSPFGKPPAVLEPLAVDWSEEDLDVHLTRFFPDGPTNIHQITLAEALVWVWNHHPEMRRRCAANVVCFTRDVRPAQEA